MSGRVEVDVSTVRSPTDAPPSNNAPQAMWWAGPACTFTDRWCTARKRQRLCHPRQHVRGKGARQHAFRHVECSSRCLEAIVPVRGQEPQQPVRTKPNHGRSVVERVHHRLEYRPTLPCGVTVASMRSARQHTQQVWQPSWKDPDWLHYPPPSSPPPRPSYPIPSRSYEHV